MIKLLHGDCLEVLKSLPENSIDAVVTDPPAGIAFMGKDWDKDKGGRESWVAWMKSVASEVIRVIKPGGHAFVWAIPRTSHWTGTAWEEAGWEVRDKVFHCFGSGFPKSLDVSKAIDKAAGAKRKVVGSRTKAGIGGSQTFAQDAWTQANRGSIELAITAPATPEAQQWAGWGTALKPAVEEWWLFRKPLSEKTVAANVLEHGTGALNIDGCRVAYPAGQSERDFLNKRSGSSKTTIWGEHERIKLEQNLQGRFPSQLIHDGSDEVLALFPESKDGVAVGGKGRSASIYGSVTGGAKGENQGYGGSGSAARFFYCAKPSRRERNEGIDTEKKNFHPTVKALSLMKYLIKLITREGHTVLDPFLGSGSTGVACVNLGFNFIGIEKEKEYFEIATNRIQAAEKERAESFI